MTEAKSDIEEALKRLIGELENLKKNDPAKYLEVLKKITEGVDAMKDALK